MLCAPLVSAVVEKLATPPVIVPVPIVVVPSRKVTVPVGFVPVTVAVKVTDAPNAGVAEEVVRAVVERGTPTAIATGEDVLSATSGSFKY